MALGIFSSKPVKPEDISPVKMKVYLGVVAAIIVCAIGLKIFGKHNTNNGNTNILLNTAAQNINANIANQNSNATINTNVLLNNANQNLNANLVNQNSNTNISNRNSL